MSCPVCTADARFLRTVQRPEYESAFPQVRLVDLFAGGGGLSLGLAEAAARTGLGSEIVLAVEQLSDVANVYRRNFPGSNVIEADVRDLFDGRPGSALTSRERELRAQVGTVHVLLAGPPCQGHSDLNNHTRRRDRRNGLYVRVARAAEVLRPVLVLIENVPAVRNDRGSAVPKATSVLRRAGYEVATDVLDLLKFGVPQRRLRHILLASRCETIDPEAILSGLTACCGHQPRTVRWAIEDLLDVGSARPFDIPSVPSPANAARMEWLVDQDEYDLPNERRPKCHQAPHSYTSMYGRLRWDAPAQTVTTGFGSPGQGRYVHPSRPRTISPHEAARLQTFPDFFDLGSTATRRAWAHVIGNAVPPLLGAHLGLPILKGIASALVPTTEAQATREAVTDEQPDLKSTITRQAGRRPGVPPASSEVIRRRMSATKHRDTKPELAVRSELHRLGLRFFVDRSVDGTRRRADILFPADRVAVYVDGCYWHGCTSHGTMPKENREWWTAKIAANRARDEDTVARLTDAGWTVLRFWEHDDPTAAAEQIRSIVARRKDARRPIRRHEADL